MKKMMPGVTAAVAACIIVAGCKVPKNERLPRTSRNAAVTVSSDYETAATAPMTPATPAAAYSRPATPVTPVPAVEEPVPTSDIEVTTVPAPVVDVKPVAAEPAPAPAPAPTVYTIQKGDTVSILSKRFNVRMEAIEKANPGLNRDKVRIGQKINIPAVSGEVKAEPAAKLPPAPKGEAKPEPKTVEEYTGPVKEYVVKAGDTLGGIAYANGINIRQLKKLNNIPMGQQNNTVRIGQKLKIPAEPPAKPAKSAKPAEPQKTETVTPTPNAVVAKPEPAATPAVQDATVQKPLDEVVEIKINKDVTKAPAVQPVPAEQPAEAPGVKTYTTQEGDDIVQLAIEFEIAPGQLVDANSDILSTPADTLKPGMVLKLPANAKVKK